MISTSLNMTLSTVGSGYVVFTIVGWIATKVYARTKDMHNLYLKTKVETIEPQ